MATALLLGTSPAETVLIDRTGVIRRVLTRRILTGADLEEFVGTWQAGKTYYLAYCGRRHGSDADETCCDPNPLIEMSRRRTLRFRDLTG